MPLTLVDRMPLPTLRVYAAGSSVLLAAALYHALAVTGDAGWRANASLPQAAAEAEDVTAALPPDLGRSQNLTEQFVEVMTFMMQEPLCMWTLLNACYCLLAVLGAALQRLVFGALRVAEAQRLKDKFWNYLFYKFIFIFGVINVQYMDEVLLWCLWFTALGSLQLLAQLCKDRFEYLSYSASSSGWAHARLGSLLSVLTLAAAASLAVAVRYGLPAGRDVFFFMATESVLALVWSLQTCACYALRALGADAAAAQHYYTHLVFDTLSLVAQLCEVSLSLVRARLCVSLGSLALLQRLRAVLHALRARRSRHRAYTAARDHVNASYPMASPEEMEANSDHCAICWEPMAQARRLPCTHLFHNGCLTRWLQQDASCPTCRRPLPPPAPAHPPPLPPPPAPLNHLFHFDGSRYVSWLPSFSVEVTRARLAPPHTSQTDALARQVQAMFPQYSLSTLSADLAATRSADLTIDNILEGRLPRDSNTAEPSTSAPRLVDAATSTAPEPATTSSPTSTSSSAAAGTVADGSADHTLNDWEEEVPLSGPFAEESSEREAALARRKQQLVSAARRRYLQRRAATAPQPHRTAPA